MHTNRKRAQTKAVNQARKEQEAAAVAGQPESGQMPASDMPAFMTGAAPSATPSPLAYAGQLLDGAGSLSMDAHASQPAFGQQQPQPHYGGAVLLPSGSVTYPAQQHHSNHTAPYMQMAPQTAAAYAAAPPHSGSFPMAVAQPSPSATVPHSAAYGMVPQAAPHSAAAQSVPYALPAPSTAQQMQPPQYAGSMQQQQPQVLHLRPLPGQSMAEAAMAAVQAQQVLNGLNPVVIKHCIERHRSAGNAHYQHVVEATPDWSCRDWRPS